jgi:dephospho-CoA kinase
MLIIGLTGSIATGKSTISRLLSNAPYKIPLIDADVIAREVVEPGTPGYAKIVSHFGESILQPAAQDSKSKSNPKGRPLDRAALGRLVFGASPEATRNRKVLNSIVHPAVRWRMASLVLQAYVKGAWAVVLDVPLLFESGLDIFCGTVLVVGVSDSEIQLRRLLERDRKMSGSMTEDEARGRVASQGNLEWKVGRVERRREAMGVGAAEVVWNDSGLDDLEREVAGVVGRWRRGQPGWWRILLWLFMPLGLVVAGWWFFRGWWIRRQCIRKEEKNGKGR